ncbi:ATP synthase subunit delta [Durusdinium trenchii]|uniref:ATP synthase subunit delta n=1 Tax=Durusdinium trenchii TaxID=1381693 RepID=A0ABP0QQY4_9DINO
MAASSTEKESCLFLSEWESARHEHHLCRRKHVEKELHRQQLQLQSALASLNSWLAILESRRKLNEVAASAAAQALSELETRWRPLRLELDAEVAGWLLGAEQSYAAKLSGQAKLWAAAAPEGGTSLRQRLQALSEHLASRVVAAIRLWDESHQAAEQAWQSHHERVEEAARAISQERAPPDSWLSEVQYRERARKHVTELGLVEELLRSSAEQLETLEAQRAEYWTSLAESYRVLVEIWVTVQIGTVEAPPAPPAPPAPHSGSSCDDTSSDVPRLKLGSLEPAATLPPWLGDNCGGKWLPDMPTAYGAVLQRVPAAMMTPSGLFGRGSEWREGATLVLTIHGYLHLFLPDPKAKKTTENSPEASVYAPRATKCVFQRRGQELVVDLAEQEPEPATPDASPPAGGGAAGVLRKWWGGKGEPWNQAV